MIIFTQSGEIEKEVNSPIDIIEVFDSLKEKPLLLAVILVIGGKIILKGLVKMSLNMKI